MADLVQFYEHGEAEKTFVCSYLAEQGIGLGFNR